MRGVVRLIVIAVVVLVVCAWSVRVLDGDATADLGDGLIVLMAWLVSAADKVIAPRVAATAARVR